MLFRSVSQSRYGKVAVYVHAPTAGGASHTLMIEGNAAPFSFTARGEFFSGVKTKRDILGKLKRLDGYSTLDLNASAFASNFALDRYNKKLKEQTFSNETGTKQE